MYNILQISDLHFLRSYPQTDLQYINSIRNGPSLDEKLRSCAVAAGKRKLDALIVTGDISDYGYAEDYVHVRDKLEKFFPHIPLAFTPGNHDVNREFSKGMFGRAYDGRPLNAVFDCGDICVISLDSSRDEVNSGTISEDQCDYLLKALQHGKGKTTLLITHFHLLDGQDEMPPCSFPAALRSIVAESDVSAIFTGHTHHSYNGFFAGKPYFTAPSFSFYGQENADGSTDYLSCYGCNLYSLDEKAVHSVRTEIFF